MARWKFRSVSPMYLLDSLDGSSLKGGPGSSLEAGQRPPPGLLDCNDRLHERVRDAVVCVIATLRERVLKDLATCQKR